MFLQRVLEDFSIVPILVLDAARASLAFGADRGRPMRAGLSAGLSPALRAMRASFVTLTAESFVRALPRRLRPDESGRPDRAGGGRARPRRA